MASSEVATSGTVKVGAGAVVCESVDFDGPHPVTVGANCVIGPNCRIVAAKGPIFLGTGNVVEENVLIENTREESLVIGDCNVFQVGCIVKCGAVGSLNVFEVKSHAGASVARVGSGCVVGVGVELGLGNAGEQEASELVNGQVAYRVASEVRFRQAKRLGELHSDQNARYLEILRDEKSRSALAKYHKLRAAN